MSFVRKGCVCACCLLFTVLPVYNYLRHVVEHELTIAPPNIGLPGTNFIAGTREIAPQTVISMGFCRRCGDIVTQERCGKCGGLPAGAC